MLLENTDDKNIQTDSITKQAEVKKNKPSSYEDITADITAHS
jgi:hypothetical protein